MAWQLRDDRYVEALRLRGTETASVPQPYPLERQPHALID